MKSFRTFNQHLYETAAPGQEKFIKDAKEDFKKRYGKDWQRVLYATAWKRHDEDLKECADILNDILEDFVVSEEFEQLDELSKKTLGSYLSKSVERYGLAKDKQGQLYNKGEDFSDYGVKVMRYAGKRKQGIDRAIKKLSESVIDELMLDEDFQQLDELSKKTLTSYIKKATKDGEEKHDVGLYRASKREAQMSTGSALRSRVDRLQWKSPVTAKPGEARSYDSAREELKQRGEHHFAGNVNRSGRVRDVQEPRRDPVSGRMNEEQLSEGYRNVEHRKRDSMFWRDMHYHNANPIGDPEYSHETETHKISFHAPTNTWKLKNKKTNEIQNGSGGLRNLHRALTNLKEESTDFYHFTDDVIVTEESKAHIEFKRMGVEYRVTHDGSVVEVKDKLGWHRTYALNIVELARKILQQHFGGQQ